MQIHEITALPVQEGILKGVADVAKTAFTRGAFRYGAAQTGVNLAPYFPEKDGDERTIRLKDNKGVYHTYTKSGEKWYDENNKEVDPGHAAMLDNQAKQQAAAKPTADTTPTATTAPASTASTTPTAAPPSTTRPGVMPQTSVAPSKIDYNVNLAPAAKKRTGGRVAGQLSQTPGAIRKRAARLANKTGAPADAGANAFGSMTQQLAPVSRKSSTGGTITQTPTGLRHAAKPAAKKTVTAKTKPVVKKTPAKKTTTAKPTWTGRKKGLTKQQQDYIAAINKNMPQSLAEQNYNNLEKMLAQAMAAQGQKV